MYISALIYGNWARESLADPWGCSTGKLRLGTLPVPVARRLLPVALRFWVAVGARGPPGATFGRFLSILGRFSEVRALLSVTFFATFAKNGKVAFVWPWPHEPRVGTFKKRPKIDEKAIEKRKGYFFGVKTLPVRVFLARGRSRRSLGVILGLPRGFGEALLGALCALRGRPGGGPVNWGGPWALRRRPGRVPGAILGRFWSIFGRFLVDFWSIFRRFRH